MQLIEWKDACEMRPYFRYTGGDNSDHKRAFIAVLDSIAMRSSLRMMNYDWDLLGNTWFPCESQCNLSDIHRMDRSPNWPPIELMLDYGALEIEWRAM